MFWGKEINLSFDFLIIFFIGYVNEKKRVLSYLLVVVCWFFGFVFGRWGIFIGGKLLVIIVWGVILGIFVILIVWFVEDIGGKFGFSMIMV